MARLGAAAALDVRQLSAGNLAGHSMQFASQGAMASDTLPLRATDPSPSESVDLSILNASFASNITSDISTSFLESGSQDTFSNLGSAALIPISQPQPGSATGSLAPADEWSGTTAVSSTSNAQQHPQQGLTGSISSQGQNNLSAVSSAERSFQSMKQDPFVFDSHPTASSQAGLEILQGKPVMDQKVLNFQTGFDQATRQSGTQQVPMQRTVPNMQGFQGRKFQSQQVSSGVVTSTTGEPGFLSHQSLSQTGSANNGQDFSFQESSFQGAFAGATSLELDGCDLGTDQPDFDVGQLAGHRPGHQGHLGNGQLQGLPEGAGQQLGQQLEQHLAQQLGQHGEPLHVSRAQLTNQPLSYSRPHGAPGMNYHNQQSNLQSPRILGMIQGASQPVIQQPGLSSPSQYFSSPHSSLQPNTAANSLSYQHAAVKRQPSLSHMQAHQALSQAHARAQAANQQAAANHQAIYQMGGQQAMYSTSQHPHYHGHQAGTGLKLPGGVQQMIANMQPTLQSQLLQGLKARQCLHNSASGLPGFRGAAAEGISQSPMPVSISSQCLQVLRLYIQEQRKRPQDNNIGFWRNLVREFFAPGGRKRWCLTSYNNSSPVGKHAQGLFPMEYWFCNICGVQPGRGFESCTDVLPRLFKIKFDSGLVDELLFLDAAEEYVLSSGKFVLEYPNAVHESIFQELRVVRYGRLRVTFSPALKIHSWEFCTTAHEEVVPRKNLLQQAHQLASLVIEADQEGFDASVENLKSHCNSFAQTARQLAMKLDAPGVNDLGFSKRYVRCLQISEVVNSMKDLISFDNKTKLGPIEALAQFPNARKLQMNGLLSGASGSLTQIINHLTQGPASSTPATHTSGLVRVPSQSLQQQLQGQLLNQLQGSSIPQLRDFSNMKLPQQFANLQPQIRSQMEARSLNLSHSQGSMHQMQPPAAPHLQPLGQGQTLSGNQAPSQFSAQAISHQSSLSQLQSPGLSQAQSQAFSQAQALSQVQSQSQGLSQLSSQALNQSVNYSQLGPQMYQQVFAKQMGPQSSGQAISQSAQSLNQNAGQQSLPGTPQSEMSDMRTTA